MTKLIINVEELCKSFVNSRLMILERTRICSSNFIYAIAQSCFIMMNFTEEKELKICNAVNGAVKIIKRMTTSNDLYSMLSSHFATYYRKSKMSLFTHFTINVNDT